MMDWGDKEQVLESVSVRGSDLRYATEALRNDHEVVLAAVNENGYVLRYASKNLQQDPEIRKATRLA